jgi:hypothetical protein
MPRLVRKHLPGYRSGGSIGYHALRELAPSVIELYESDALRAFLSRIANLELLTCPNDDPHACAIYHYDHAGDRVGYHYDTSWYDGARFTVLLGLEDTSSARLCCETHTRDRHRQGRKLEVATKPGTLVFFNGDRLRHSVSSLQEGEQRTVLTLQYVSCRRMAGWRRAISQIKDALTYFGREVWASPRPALPPGTSGS